MLIRLYEPGDTVKVRYLPDTNVRLLSYHYGRYYIVWETTPVRVHSKLVHTFVQGALGDNTIRDITNLLVDRRNER